MNGQQPGKEWPLELHVLRNKCSRRARIARWIAWVFVALLVALLIGALIFVVMVLFWPNQLGKAVKEDVREIRQRYEPMEPPDLYGIRICGNTGLAVGEDGFVLLSGDGGDSWNHVESKTDSNLYAIAFAEDCSSALIAGRRGTILDLDFSRKSKSGEVQPIKSNSTDAFTDIALSADADGRIAVAVGKNGRVQIFDKNRDSKDRDWTNPGNISLGGDLNAVAVSADGRTVVVAGDRRTLVRSAGFGKRGSWRAATVEGGRDRTDFQAVALDKRGTAVAVGEDGFIWVWPDKDSQPTNASATDKDGKNIRGDFEAVVIGPLRTAVAVGDDGLAWISTGDNFANWSASETRVGQRLNDVAVDPDGKSFVAVGDNGTVLLTADGGANWCQPDAGTGADLDAVAFGRDGDTAFAFAVGQADERMTLLKIDPSDCGKPATPIMVDLPDVLTGEERATKNPSPVTPDLEFIVIYLTIGFVRLAAILVFLYMVHHVIGLIRYYLRLAAFYEGRADAVLMTDGKQLPLSRSIWTFERSANALTPRDIDFEGMSRSMAKEVLRLTRSLLQRK